MDGPSNSSVAGVQAKGDAQGNQGIPQGVHRRTEKTKSSLGN